MGSRKNSAGGGGAAALAPVTGPAHPLTAPVSMRAVTQHEYGDTDTLQIGQVAVPVLGAGEVLVRVGAAGVDRGT